MKPLVSIIMGSTSDLPVMEKAARFFDELEIPFELHALSAHRTPAQVDDFAALPPPRIPEATVAGTRAHPPATLPAQMLAVADASLAEKLAAYKEGLKDKIVRANAELAGVSYKFKTN